MLLGKRATQAVASVSHAHELSDIMALIRIEKTLEGEVAKAVEVDTVSMFA
jgi:hypothetical protein